MKFYLKIHGSRQIYLLLQFLELSELIYDRHIRIKISRSSRSPNFDIASYFYVTLVFILKPPEIIAKNHLKPSKINDFQSVLGPRKIYLLLHFFELSVQIYDYHTRLPYAGPLEARFLITDLLFEKNIFCEKSWKFSWFF